MTEPQLIRDWTRLSLRMPGFCSLEQWRQCTPDERALIMDEAGVAHEHEHVHLYLYGRCACGKVIVGTRLTVNTRIGEDD